MAKKPNCANVKKIGRKRRAAGWTLLLLGLLVAGMWVWSQSRHLTVRSDQSEIMEVSFSHGNAIALWTTDARLTNWKVKFAAEPLHPVVPRSGNVPAWMPWEYTEYKGVRIVICAIWPLPLLLGIPAALLLSSASLARRRAMTGSCDKCGYSLTGLASDAPCPECGKRAKATA